MQKFLYYHYFLDLKIYMKMIKKIAIYGGAFDPVHNSHISLILSLAQMSILDQLWLLPSGERNDKKLLFPTQDRFQILKQLFKDHQKIKVSSQQIELSIQYKRMIPTYEFLTYLNQKYQDSKFYFVIGGDLVKDLLKWDDGQKLVAETSFIIFKRKGYQIPFNKLPPNHIFNQHQLQQISSTHIKEIIFGTAKNKKELLEGIVPSIVIENLKKLGYFDII